MFSPPLNMSRNAFMVFNFLSFQCAWLVAVNFQHSGVLTLFAIIVLHFIVSHHRQRDFCTMVLVVAFGCSVDAIASFAGLFVFHKEQLLPLWLILLWANFSLTFYYSMAWLVRCPVFIQSVLGGLFGSLSYYSAYLLGAVSYPFGVSLTIFALIVIWAFTLPVYVSIARTIRGKFYDSHRPFLSH